MSAQSQGWDTDSHSNTGEVETDTEADPWTLWLDILVKLAISRPIREARWTISEKFHPSLSPDLHTCTHPSLHTLLKPGEAGDGNVEVRRRQGVVLLWQHIPYWRWKSSAHCKDKTKSWAGKLGVGEALAGFLVGSTAGEISYSIMVL